VGFLGQVAITGQQGFLKDLNRHPGETVGFEWLRQERIRGLSATPITFKGEVLGVIIGFTRADLPEEARPWGRIFADHIGAAIANARAFEEIQRLKAQLELQNAYLQEEVVEARAFGDLVGQSAALRQIVSQIDLVAPTEASVLILGETGTGKELVAHEIHRRSRRKDGPLVRVNCASIPSPGFARPSRNPHKQGLRSFWHYKIAPVSGFCSCRAGETAVSTLSDSVASTHLNINAALSLTHVYSPYNGHLKNTTVDYQRLTTEKWRKSPLIDT
jgi:hypothetical protein